MENASSLHYLRRTYRIAWPVIFENIMISMAQFINTGMVGSLGKHATAAVAVNTTTTWFLNALPIVFSVSGTAFVAQKIGAGEKDDAEKIAANVLLFGLVSSLIIWLLMRSIAGYIPGWMGAEAAIIPASAQYMRIYVFGVVFAFMSVVASGLLRGAGNTQTPMLVSFAANIVNVLVNYFTIYSNRIVTFSVFGRGYSLHVLGLELGVAGAAIGTVSAQIITGSIMVWLVFRKKSVIRVRFSQMRHPDFKLLRQLLTVGIPASLERISISAGQIVYQRMIADLGTIQIAAHSLAITAESISYLPASGLGIAATTLVGQSLGAKKKEDALAYSKIGIISSLVMGALCGILFFFGSNFLLSLFTQDPDIIREGAAVIKIIAIVEPIFSMSYILVGIMRGAGDARVPFLAALIGMWGVRLISTHILMNVFHFGLPGAWVSMGVDIFLRTAFLYQRYKKQNWLHFALFDRH